MDGYVELGMLDITPTPRGYAQMLLALLEHAEHTHKGSEAKAFARKELTKFVVAAATLNPDAWGK